MFSRFNTIVECDRQTDGQIWHSRYLVCGESCGKERKLHSYVRSLYT